VSKVEYGHGLCQKDLPRILHCRRLTHVSAWSYIREIVSGVEVVGLTGICRRQRLGKYGMTS
jgi:hypothetical protein